MLCPLTPFLGRVCGSKRGFQIRRWAGFLPRDDVLSIFLSHICPPLRHPMLCRRSKVRGGKHACRNPGKIQGIKTLLPVASTKASPMCHAPHTTCFNSPSSLAPRSLIIYFHSLPPHGRVVAHPRQAAYLAQGRGLYIDCAALLVFDFLAHSSKSSNPTPSPTTPTPNATTGAQEVWTSRVSLLLLYNSCTRHFSPFLLAP